MLSMEQYLLLVVRLMEQPTFAFLNFKQLFFLFFVPWIIFLCSVHGL